MGLARRLARLTPFRGDIVRPPRVREANTPVSTKSPKLPPILIYTCVRIGYSSPPGCSRAGEGAPPRASPRLLRGSLKFKCQSREGTSIYCRTKARRRGGGGECGVPLRSVSGDVENGRRIAPMFALEFCPVDEDLQGWVPPSCPPACCFIAMLDAGKHV